MSILDEIEEALNKEVRQPEDITWRDLAEKIDVKKTKAISLLDEKVAEGKLTKVKVYDKQTGKHLNVYREVV